MARTRKQKVRRRKVGGLIWTQALIRNRNRTKEIVAGLEKLHRVAINTDTENFIYRLMLLCHENLSELYGLLEMEKSTLTAPEEEDDGPEDLSL